MPYKNEHAARLVDPDTLHDPWGRKDGQLGEGISAIFGTNKEGSQVMQAIRFDAGQFSPQKARDWLGRHKEEFKPILFEPAKESVAAVGKRMGVEETPRIRVSTKGVIRDVGPEGCEERKIKWPWQ